MMLCIVSEIYPSNYFMHLFVKKICRRLIKPLSPFKTSCTNFPVIRVYSIQNNCTVLTGCTWDVHVLYLELDVLLEDDLCGGVDGLGTVDTQSISVLEKQSEF